MTSVAVVRTLTRKVDGDAVTVADTVIVEVEVAAVATREHADETTVAGYLVKTSGVESARLFAVATGSRVS